MKSPSSQSEQARLSEAAQLSGSMWPMKNEPDISATADFRAFFIIV
jgi:hypothetical protein